ncbi:Cytochrome P450 6a2, partial [Pseudolycoriella hygida]
YLSKRDDGRIQMIDQVLQPSFKNGLRFMIQILFPKFMYLLKIKSVDQDVEDFIISMVKSTLHYRETNNVARKDFFQLMIQLRNTGSVQLDDQWETKIVNESQKKLSINEMAAQAFVFWVAGFETSSTTMGFCLYELARNQDIQTRVKKEIDDILAQHNGEVTFEAINDMKLLECCIDETLRLYPPVFNMVRQCNKDWQIPGTDTLIEKGVSIVIPVFALQRDAKYYPNPDQFQPERFNAENSAGKTFVERPYAPFGDGPRICIGQRLGKMQVKVGLVLLLRNYKFDLSGNTLQPLQISSQSVLFSPVNGLELKITRR